MGALTHLLARDKPVLWLDGTDYAARLLGNGTAPWLDVGEFVAWQRKAAGLLRPDVLPLAIAPLAQTWLSGDPGLRERIAARRRATVPARTLLGDDALRGHAVELARALRAALGLPLALVLPSPRAVVGWAYALAFGEAVDVDEEQADAAAVYLADFLRAFGDVGVDALLLEEARGYLPASAAEIACYQPVLNVAAHFRWDVGLRAPGLVGTPDGYAFAIGSDAWSSAPAGTLRYVALPASGQPEQVLARLAELR